MSADRCPTELRRSVRFCLPLAGGFPADAPRSNTFAAWPSMRGVGAYYEIEVRCAGEADPETGYLVGIGEIDAAVRERTLPALHEAIRTQADREPAALLARLVPDLAGALGDLLVGVRWRLTPFHAVELETNEMTRYRISQQFDFAAAHRLRCPGRSDEENRRLFGKCTNEHGHNYRVEVVASVPMPEGAAPSMLPLERLEAIVDEAVIERLDHTCLNTDVDAFSDILPSVEHIARVCHDMLDEPVAATGATLEQVTVWETEKTSATFPAR